MNNYIDSIKSFVFQYGVTVISAILVLLIGLKVIKTIHKMVEKTFQKRNVDTTLSSFLLSFTDIALKLILFAIVIMQVGVDSGAFIAVLGSAGLAIGLALQGSLSNFAGGILIMLLKPFKVGDYIEGNGESGTVEDIHVFYTKLATPDNKVIVVPNGALSNGNIVNYSAKSTRRVDLTFGVGYEQDIIKVRRVLLDLINSHDKILKTPEPFVNVSEHGDSAVNFTVRVWCNTSDYWTVYFDLMEQAKIRFDEKNISIPFPQIDVHLNSDNN